MIDPADFGDLLLALGDEVEDEHLEAVMQLLPAPVVRRIREEFFWQVHGGQEEPAGDWRVWLLMAGRGFGKTRVGAEWISARARETPDARIALVGGSRDEVAKVMIEGASGLIAVARTGESLDWVPTQGLLRFSSGAEAFVYSASAAEKLRGPEHHFAWCDELAKWEQADLAWDNLQMGMRLGERPRLIVTTTPRAVEIVRRVRALGGTVETSGRTAENDHLPEAFLEWAAQTYGGTRLGRQELDGVLFGDVAGALFTREMIEGARQSGSLPREGLKRVVVGVDPPGSVEGGCGIVVCGLGADEVVYLLADCSVLGARPDGWARAVARAAEAWQADRVIAEKNQGGDMVESVLRSAEARLPVTLVSASRGKVARAEPVAAMFENGGARLAGRFPELEDELAGLTLGGGYEGPGRSPDRADAMVWAMSALMKPAPEPRVRRL
jgi:phage terminase large subunit-like protein